MVQSCLLVNSQALCINIIKFCSQDFRVNKTLVITVIPCKYDRNHVLCGIFKYFRNAHHVCFCIRNVFTILLS